MSSTSLGVVFFPVVSSLLLLRPSLAEEAVQPPNAQSVLEVDCKCYGAFLYFPSIPMIGESGKAMRQAHWALAVSWAAAVAIHTGVLPALLDLGVVASETAEAAEAAEAAALSAELPPILEKLGDDQAPTPALGLPGGPRSWTYVWSSS